jgi:hypothetical protein
MREELGAEDWCAALAIAEDDERGGQSHNEATPVSTRVPGLPHALGSSTAGQRGCGRRGRRHGRICPRLRSISVCPGTDRRPRPLRSSGSMLRKNTAEATGDRRGAGAVPRPAIHRHGQLDIATGLGIFCGDHRSRRYSSRVSGGQAWLTPAPGRAGKGSGLIKRSEPRRSGVPEC